MLEKHVTYRSVAIVVGILLFAFALYIFFVDAFSRIIVVHGYSSQEFYLIYYSPPMVFRKISDDYVTIYLGTGVLLLCTGLQNGRVFYWALLLSLWLFSISFLYQSAFVLIVPSIFTIFFIVMYKRMVPLLHCFVGSSKLRGRTESSASVDETNTMQQKKGI